SKTLSDSGLTSSPVNGVNGVNQVNVGTKKPKSNGCGHAGDESADAAALEGEGRRLLEEAKTAPSGVQVLPTGEMIEDPAPGSRVDLRNQGNRLLEQARMMRLAEAGKRESLPVDDGNWGEI
ncbi:MAG TPA: hypothetical protein PKD21_03800, partial [Candidatus Competibacter phosphatis]|nr:hypothetical protein [Candidatus Competibacter phosphatis]